MKRILILALVLMATTAFGAYKGLVVSGGPLVEVPVAVTPDDVTPSVATGNIFITGVNTGATAITDLDNPTAGATYMIICGSIAGGFQSTIADAGNFTLEGAWNPATVGDSITLFCAADNDYREVCRSFVAAGGGPAYGDPFIAAADAVGAPGFTWAGALTDGIYHVGAGDVGIACGGVQMAHIDATGITAVGFNGPLGTVTPAQVEGTNGYFSGDFYYGQLPGDLHEGYRRTETIKFLDDFTVGNNADLAVRYDVTNVVGAGTNDETTNDGHNTLVTGGAGGPDMESTRSNGLHLYAAFTPRLECVAELATVAAGQNFYFGFWGAANDYAEIIHEPATSANWLVRVDDTGGATTHDTGVAATVNPTKLEIWVDAAGVVGAAIDDVNIAVAGLDPMTATAKYFEWRVLDVAAAAHTVEVHHFEQEQLKVE